ncbi:MAG: CPBP family intramembrane glutamic endopeptidase [Frankiaceae bacterium]
MSAGYDHAYRLAAFVLLALGSLSVASQVSRRWWPGSQRAFLVAYATTLALVVAWAVPLVAPGAIVGDGPGRWVVGVLLGLPIGVAASRADRGLLRRLTQRHDDRLPAVRRSAAGHRGAQHGAYHGGSGGYEVRSTGWASSGGAVATRARPAPGPAVTALPADALAVGLVLLVGAIEELVFRGYLAQLSLRLSAPVAALALAGTVLFFGLLHASFDWRHAVAKTPLGGLALLGALGTGTVLCAVVTHLVFNVGVLAESRRAAATMRAGRAGGSGAPRAAALPRRGAAR